jgi:hypothetical protein
MKGAADTARQITESIHRLADSDSHSRTNSAAFLWRVASELWLPLLNHWQKDPEFRELSLPVRAESPHAEPGFPAIVAGLAVHPDTFERIRAANNSPELADVPPDQDAEEFELRIGEMDFDILTTREPGGSGAIARFLDKFGEGIQQVEIYVRDVDRATDILRARFKLDPVYPVTRPGADGTRINFFLAAPLQGKKVLIELVETPKKTG